jgi:hypothetical protein
VSFRDKIDHINSRSASQAFSKGVLNTFVLKHAVCGIEEPQWMALEKLEHGLHSLCAGFGHSTTMISLR